MSGIFGGGGGMSLIPPGTEWIASAYSDLLEMVGRGQSPYPFLQQVIFLLYHPTVPRGFAVQLWFLFGLFCLCVPRPRRPSPSSSLVFSLPSPSSRQSRRRPDADPVPHTARQSSSSSA